MNDLERSVRQGLFQLVVAFRKDLEEAEASVVVYTEAMRDLEPQYVDDGVCRAIRSERFFPPPAVLRAYALEARTARTATVRPIAQSDDPKCALCGATRIWLRELQTPDPDPRYFSAKAIDSGIFASRRIQRVEIEHKTSCSLKREDQPSLNVSL
jgi:hypothetical protein